jgi:hypothetical protein
VYMHEQARAAPGTANRAAASARLSFITSSVGGSCVDK